VQFGNTLLHYSCTSSNPETTAFILKTSIPNLETRNKLGRTPLHLSSLFSNQEATKLLVSYGADIDSEDLNKNTPLHYAAVSMSIDCCRILIDSGADSWKQNSLGASCLDCIKNRTVRDAVADYAREKLPILQARNKEKAAAAATAAVALAVTAGDRGTVPIEEDAVSTVNVNLLSVEEIRASPDFENYWRIPGTLPAASSTNNLLFSSGAPASSSDAGGRRSGKFSSKKAVEPIDLAMALRGLGVTAQYWLHFIVKTVVSLISESVEFILILFSLKNCIALARGTIAFIEAALPMAGKLVESNVIKPLDQHPYVTFTAVGLFMCMLASNIR
jgi:hypothetical protein